MKITVLGAGAGGAASVVDLVSRGFDVAWWGRSPETIAPFQACGGVRHEGVVGSGIARPRIMTTELAEACDGAKAAVVVLPTFSHRDIARSLALLDWPAERPVILNPGHTGGALEFDHAFRCVRRDVPPLVEFSTLTYVARKYAPDTVTVSCRAGKVKAAAMPHGRVALALASELFPGTEEVEDVLATGLANVNMVLHPPAAVLGAAWIEATRGEFTFYVDGMTPGVARTMHRLDDERLSVARALDHELPSLIDEMRRIGTVEEDVADIDDFASAVSGGKANRRIMAPDSFDHRYYREDFGHGLLPFLEIAAIAGIETPVAKSLFTLAETMTGSDYRATGRTADAMGIAGLTSRQLLERVRG